MFIQLFYFSDMATASFDIMAQQLKCPICFEDFERPKLLMCGHTFCAHCLEGVVQASHHPGEIQCPHCRKSIRLWGSGGDELADDFRIGELRALQRSLETEKCGVCKDTTEDQFVFCMQCHMLLCHICMGNHRNKFADHKVTMRCSLSRCFHHGELRIYFCAECNFEVCKCCLLTLCLNHDTKEITGLMAAQTKEHFMEKDEVINKIFDNIKNEIQEHYKKNSDQLISKVESARWETIGWSHSYHDNCMAILNTECNRKPDEDGYFGRNAEAMTLCQKCIPNVTMELGQLDMGMELSTTALPPALTCHRDNHVGTGPTAPSSGINTGDTLGLVTEDHQSPEHQTPEEPTRKSNGFVAINLNRKNKQHVHYSLMFMYVS